MKCNQYNHIQHEIKEVKDEYMRRHDDYKYFKEKLAHYNNQALKLLSTNDVNRLMNTPCQNIQHLHFSQFVKA